MPASRTSGSILNDIMVQRSNETSDLAICIDGVANLHRTADSTSECVSQCLFGETLDIMERRGDWTQIRTHLDNYPGHVRTASIRPFPRSHEPTLIVGVRATLVFARPDIKSHVVLRIPLGAELTIDEAVLHDDFACVRIPVATDDPVDLPRVGYVWRDHTRHISVPLDGTPVDLARRLYADVPYRWGGRTPDGVDCSGLLQGTMRMLGLALPRDSGLQETSLSTVMTMPERAASDVVFWPGHVALLIDPDTLFHATAHCLGTAVERLTDVIERAGEPSSIRRLPTAI